MSSRTTSRAPRLARPDRLLLAATVGVGVLSVWASISVLRTPFNQCDNLAGTCIRMRQMDAINLIITSCLVSSAGLVLSVIMLCAGARPARWYVFALALCGALAVAVLAVDPVSHLNNRWSGWLSGNP
jgi:hypothetical protein